ncbi:hypothetical protein NE237_031057 [Protea cynaroides]|uniref:Benzyl alcohol O-benzoyltransferase n=1 Tax=Protea cynaroides TaxID=273540 RepID=A0A9Q0GVD3_9MAGN|nr:hypothetical protein NE237_031057 [Protea cynaroides]
MTPSSSISLVFTVQRREPELVAPAKPTPHEFKFLSNIDDQQTLRTQVPVIQFYRNEPAMRGQDPVRVIRKAIAEALVFYYPFAGRLREGPGRKLVVDCTGEGVLFIEADANVRLEQFGDALQPPFPCLKELLYDVPGSSAVLGCPLLLIQVTRMMCGGFIFTLRMNHAMSDAAGLVQIMSAVGEIARGALVPFVPPMWERELLHPRNPPRLTFSHPEYDEMPNNKGTLIPHDNMYLSDPKEDVRVIFIVNTRAKFKPPLPVEYYGNALAHMVAISSVAKLCNNLVGYALELVKKSKADGKKIISNHPVHPVVDGWTGFERHAPQCIGMRVFYIQSVRSWLDELDGLETISIQADVTEEYMRSLVDLLELKWPPLIMLEKTYLVSDLRCTGFREVDFGWGQPVYGGPALGKVTSFYIPFRNHKGEDGIVEPFYLTGPAMEKLEKEIESMRSLPSMNLRILTPPSKYPLCELMVNLGLHEIKAQRGLFLFWICHV